MFRCQRSAYTKTHLRAVGARSSVGHGEHAGASVLLDEVLILKLLAVDALSTGSVSAGEVATLTVD